MTENDRSREALHAIYQQRAGRRAAASGLYVSAGLLLLAISVALSLGYVLLYK